MLRLKHLIKSFVFAILLLSLTFTLIACQEYSTNIRNNDGTVFHYGSDKHVKIPDKIDDVEITQIYVRDDYSELNPSYPAKKLSIPDTIKEINQKSFKFLNNLEEFYVDPRNPYFQSIDGVLYNKPATVLLCYPAEKKGETFTIPDGIRVIADEAFSGNNYLKEIIIPNTVTEIGESAFAYLEHLKDIAIPDSVTHIKEKAFNYCTQLESVSLGSSVRKLEDGVFEECKSLESIALPDSVQSMGVDLFKRCTSLKEVTLPQGITTIKSGMFASCSSLSSFIFPDTLRHIEGNAFAGTALEEITLHEGLLSIDSAFQYCKHLKEVRLPEGLLMLGNAFQGCTSLTSITIPASLELMSSAFRDCINLESITFLGGGINFSTNCFVNCQKLKAVHVQSNTDWASMIFSHAEANPFLYGAKLYIDGEFVTDFEFPSDTTVINSYLFANYSYLESVTIPEGVEAIHMGAFMKCNQISEIALPSTLNNIEHSTFSSCASLKTIYLPSLDWWLKLKQHSTDLFENAETVYVDGNITTQIVIPDGTERIESYTFYQCDFLTDIHIPVSVRYLGTYSFCYCGDINIHYGASTKEFKYLDQNSHYWNEYGTKCIIYCTDGEITT